MRRLLKEIAGGGQVTGDTTTLEDFNVLAKLKGIEEWDRSSGVQEFRSSGVQEFRSSGVQEFRSSGVQDPSWKTISLVKLSGTKFLQAKWIDPGFCNSWTPATPEFC
jgi:hypothetical protein